jgi:hypothetical protein
MVEWCPLRVLVSETAQCHLTLNLLSGEPYGMPFISFDDGISVNITPSGLVPGGGIDARDLELKFVCGGQGPYGFFIFCFKVICENWEDCFVISFFFGPSL